MPMRRTSTTDRDLESYRSEFPVLERKAYLISASLGPVSDRSRAYLDEYIDAWATKGAPDHVWFEDIFPRMRALKTSFARLAGCDADELAITTNISIALSTIASALDFGDRNKVVMSELDFPTDGHVWLAHAKRGVEIVWLRSPDGLTIPLEEYDRAIDERTAVVMVNRVLYRSSAIVDAKEVCRMARERGALSFVDDYHGIGIVPLDLHDLGCDVYTAGVLKWLCGGPGLAFLYVRRDAAPHARAGRDRLVRRRPSRSRSTPSTSSTTPPRGGSSTGRRRRRSSSSPRAGSTSSPRSRPNGSALARASSATTSSRGPTSSGCRCGRRATGPPGAASSTSASGPRPAKICHALLERDVCTDYRGDGLRISPHFFNTEEDVDRCFDELRSLL